MMVIFEVLLILPLYFTIFAFFFRFRRLNKMIGELENIFADCSLGEETPQEEPGKREFLIAQVEMGKADKLPGKTPWTQRRLEKATDQVIEKLHHEYIQADAKHKNETTGKAVGAHVISMYSRGVSRVLKIDNVDQLRRDIDNDPIIRDSMANVRALMVGTFGRLLAPLLVAAHTANHTEGFAKGEEDMINGRQSDAENLLST